MEYEYKVVNRTLSSEADEERMLNDLGRDGWALVGISQIAVSRWLYLSRQVKQP